MPKSLVTGGAGFIGSHVSRHLRDSGHEVVVLDDLSGGFVTNVPKGVQFIKGDITNSVAMGRLFERWEFDYVFHLAAYAAEGLSHFIRRFNYTNNVIGSMNLINESVRCGIKRFVFTSSIAVYGTNELPMTEHLTPKPEDPYGIAKLTVELDLAAAYEMFGLNYTIFRPHNVFGPGQNIADPYRNVVGIFMRQVLNGERLTVFGDGLQTRAFSYIDDVAPVIAAAVDVPGSNGQVYNVGSDFNMTVLEVAHTVADMFGERGEITHLPPRNEVRHAWADHHKVREAFSGMPFARPNRLDEGIRHMAEWARVVWPVPATQSPKVEVGDSRLPAGWTA